MTLKRKIQGTRKSLTIWFNGTVGTVALGLPEALQLLPQLQAYLPADYFKPLMAIALIGNILLRFRTNRGLDQK